MSHFSVLVVCPDGTTLKDYKERVDALMAPYDENREVVWEASDEYDDGGTWHNPDGHWDYWVVGGRWRGYFPVAPGLNSDDLTQVVCTDGRVNRFLGRYDGFDPSKQEGRVDGGPKRCLGFDKLRDQRGREAVTEWNNYAAAVLGTEQHTYWSEFRARVEASENAAALALGASRRGLIDQCYKQATDELGLTAGDDGWPKGATESEWDRWKARDAELWKVQEARWNEAQTYTLDEARVDYGDQPRVRAVRSAPTFAKQYFLEIDEIDRYTRDEYEARARATAVPSFAIVLPNGEWCAPGRMGWFGMSSDSKDDRQAFAERMNTYLDELSGDTFIVAVDCHV